MTSSGSYKHQSMRRSTKLNIRAEYIHEAAQSLDSTGSHTKPCGQCTSGAPMGLDSTGRKNGACCRRSWHGPATTALPTPNQQHPAPTRVFLGYLVVTNYPIICRRPSFRNPTARELDPWWNRWKGESYYWTLVGLLWRLCVWEHSRV